MRTSSFTAAFSRRLAIALALLLAVVAGLAVGTDRSVLDRSQLGFRLSYPSGWVLHESLPPPVPLKYEMEVLHYDRLEVPGRMEVRVMLLANPQRRGPETFLTVGEVHGEPFVPREQADINGVPSVQFGQAFDPPAYGLVAHRVEMMAAIAPDRVVHVDVVALPVVDALEVQLTAFDIWQSITPVHR